MYVCMYMYVGETYLYPGSESLDTPTITFHFSKTKTEIIEDYLYSKFKFNLGLMNTL